MVMRLRRCTCHICALRESFVGFFFKDWENNLREEKKDQCRESETAYFPEC